MMAFGAALAAVAEVGAALVVMVVQAMLPLLLVKALWGLVLLARVTEQVAVLAPAMLVEAVVMPFTPQLT
jgi:hypothetical protein